MSATMHKLIQGSPEWLDHRKGYFNASDAPAMLGLSQYKSRDALLREKATGITPVIDEATQRLFDAGHAAEAAARPIAEKIIGEDLFSPTMSKIVDGLNLSASFDGLTLLDDVVWEHKMLNASLKENLQNKIIPEQYKPQLEQQMLISGAEAVLFMASNDDEEHHLWYESEPLLRKRLIAGWKQFAEDLKNWKPVEVVEQLKVSDIEQLPALNVQINGSVTKSNLVAYKNTALQFIAAINTNLQTDQDFADADAMVKFCGKTEKELDAVKKAALSQTADIDDLFSTIDTLKAEMRSKRLELDKLVKARKQDIRGEIVMAARNTFGAHLAKLDERLHNEVRMPDIDTDFGGAIKNKRTIESLHNAVNTELAHCKIEANEVCDRIDANMQTLHEIAPDHRFLFNDLQDTCTKANDDFTAMVKLRVSEHEEQAMRKLEAERERIRKEEQEKAEAKLAAEQHRIAKEEQDKEIVEEEQKRYDEMAARAIEEEKRIKADGERIKAEAKEYSERKLKERTADVEHASEQIASEELANVVKKVNETLKESVNDPCIDFDKWWDLEGSGFTPYATEDMEEFAYRIARLAWSNGTFVTNRNIEYGSPRRG